MTLVNVRAGIAPGLNEVHLDGIEERMPIQAIDEVDTAVVTPSIVTLRNNESIEIEGDSTTHGRTWKLENIYYRLNGLIPPKTWKVIGQVGHVLTRGNAPRDFSPFDFFTYTFLLMHLSVIVRLTNSNLEESECRSVTRRENLKFFGVLVMMTKSKVGNRRDLWRTTLLTQYGPVANFGSFMSRGRFYTIDSAIQFSPISEYSGDLEAPSRWSVVTGLVDAINQLLAINVTSSKHVCVDESMSRWYGLGGHWMDIRLPHYAVLDRKPENGCEIRTAARGQSGMILRLDFVGGAVNTQGRALDDDYSARAAAALRHVKPWLRRARIVCGDSWFALVSTAQSLMRYETRLIGVVKGGTRQFSMAYLCALELTSRCDHVSMVSHRGGDYMKLLALLWMDRQRR